MKTLNEIELGAIEGGTILPSDIPLPSYVPPGWHAPAHGYDNLSTTPSYLNG